MDTSRKGYGHVESAAVHGGIYGDAFTGSVNTPIYQTSTYEQEALGRHKGWEYSRTGNPTRAALEALIAELENGRHGFAFAFGLAAITAVLSLFRSGDRIALSENVYGGTFRVLDRVFANFGIGYERVDTADLAKTEQVLAGEGVKAILIESPTNPLLEVSDIAAVCAAARARGILSIVDNTFMTPYLQRPLDLGADIVVHSATKYLGGHSDLIAGLAVVRDDALAERVGYVQNATGGILQPFDSFLLIRGIKTLALRMDRHAENALAVARFLQGHAAVRQVHYPGLADAPGHALQMRQATNGGGMLSFDLAAGYDHRLFFESLSLIALAESLGGVESLVCHPASMTHASIPAELRERSGITDGLIRLSVGIEHAEDIIADLGQAIRSAGNPGSAGSADGTGNPSSAGDTRG
ncbi:MAG: PLP-dependent aspartate aminotransferase family protein [Clostridiales Family XIII bacterium]|jgi:cystathionine beta-lyase|nr:PLP-dependent aspartate aminotransferase family protein [Clostridiales Family XIII bacterium]